MPVTDADEYDPQAVILGGRVELAELSSLLLHAPSTQNAADSLTACPQKLSVTLAGPLCSPAELPVAGCRLAQTFLGSQKGDHS